MPAPGALAIEADLAWADELYLGKVGDQVHAMAGPRQRLSGTAGKP